MSWTDQHQTEETEDDQILSEEFDDWVREGAAPGEEDESEIDQADTTVDEADSSAEDNEDEQARVASMSSGTVSRQGSDKPLMMDQCPRCDGREFVSKKLVYEEFHYNEDGTLEEHLAEPLTLSGAITELKTTITMYEQTDMGPDYA